MFCITAVKARLWETLVQCDVSEQEPVAVAAHMAWTKEEAPMPFPVGKGVGVLGSGGPGFQFWFWSFLEGDGGEISFMPVSGPLAIAW